MCPLCHGGSSRVAGGLVRNAGPDLPSICTLTLSPGAPGHRSWKPCSGEPGLLARAGAHLSSEGGHLGLHDGGSPGHPGSCSVSSQPSLRRQIPGLCRGPPGLLTWVNSGQASVTVLPGGSALLILANQGSSLWCGLEGAAGRRDPEAQPHGVAYSGRSCN